MKHYTVMNVSELLLYPTAQINHTGIEWSERRHHRHWAGGGLPKVGMAGWGCQLGKKKIYVQL